MLKNILNVNGVQKLNKNQQGKVSGGLDPRIRPVEQPCGKIGGGVSNINAQLCSIYGGVYLGNNRCAICH